MIVFKYTKKDGAEYVSHLDMLRHLNKILKRANVPTEFSKGFNPHMNIYMSAPIGVGVLSEAEFCLVESAMDAGEFLQAFNAHAFKGIECTFAINVNKKINVAGIIDRASYIISGINKFDLSDVLSAETFEFTNKKGARKEIRSKIFDMSWYGEDLYATLSFGNEGVRPDLLGEELIRLYGGKRVEVTKKNVFVKEVLFEDYLQEFKL